MKQDIIFFDTETTDSSSEARLIQIGIMRLGYDDAPWGQYFRVPERAIDCEAMAVHHITNEYLQKMATSTFAESAVKMAMKIASAENDIIFVAHNAPFDIQVMANEGIEIKNYIDTLRVCQANAEKLGEPKKFSLQYLRYFLGLYKIESMETAAAHDAVGDVVVLNNLWNYLTNNVGLTVEQMLEATKQPILLRTLPFGKHFGKTFAEIWENDISYLIWLGGQSNINPDLRHTIEHWVNKPRKTKKIWLGSPPGEKAEVIAERT